TLVCLALSLSLLPGLLVEYPMCRTVPAKARFGSAHMRVPHTVVWTYVLGHSQQQQSVPAGEIVIVYNLKCSQSSARVQCPRSDSGGYT
ncbi:hypothetical protein BC826DRAFT_1045876, partial [Russula brevipes]